MANHTKQERLFESLCKLTMTEHHPLTFSPFSRISSALGPRTVQWTAIFSFLLMPKERTVYLALENTGFCPVRLSSTCGGHAKAGKWLLTRACFVELSQLMTLFYYFSRSVFWLDKLNANLLSGYFVALDVWINRLNLKRLLYHPTKHNQSFSNSQTNDIHKKIHLKDKTAYQT